MDRPSRLVQTYLSFSIVLAMFRLLCANSFTNNDRKTKAVNYCESRDPDDGETLQTIEIILIRLLFWSAYCFNICILLYGN